MRRPPSTSEAITADSRVTPGALFAALAGSRTDGARFIADVVAMGAAAVLVPEGTTADAGARSGPRTREPRRALALMAARIHPRQPAHMPRSPAPAADLGR